MGTANIYGCARSSQGCPGEYHNKTHTHMAYEFLILNEYPKWEPENYLEKKPQPILRITLNPVAHRMAKFFFSLITIMQYTKFGQKVTTYST